nr:NAD(P)H-binding protein [Bacillus subtilis]
MLANLEGVARKKSPMRQKAVTRSFSQPVPAAKTGYDKTPLVDLDGAAKAIEAADIAGIKRFIMVSALQAHNRENWNEALKPYYVAKHYADKILEASGLTYTIIRPGGLRNEPGTGTVSANEGSGAGIYFP